MNHCCCTIITEDYLPFTRALNESLQKGSGNIPCLYILVCKEGEISHLNAQVDSTIRLLSIQELCTQGIGLTIKERYFGSNMDAFRWSMKPVLINYLIKERSYDKVLYLDCDIFFFNDYTFLFDLLDSYDVILTPHFRSSDPAKDYTNYILQFNSGIYNAGFLGVSKRGIAAMEWLAYVCSLICEIDPCKGQFVDQTHLNLIPIYFKNTHILQHRGCNVANWNQLECKRVVQSDGTVLINDEYPIIFIHFTASTVRGILNQQDGVLNRYLDMYAQTLRKFDKGLDITRKYKITRDQHPELPASLAKRMWKKIISAVDSLRYWQSLDK